MSPLSKLCIFVSDNVKKLNIQSDIHPKIKYFGAVLSSNSNQLGKKTKSHGKSSKSNSQTSLQINSDFFWTKLILVFVPKNCNIPTSTLYAILHGIFRISNTKYHVKAVKEMHAKNVRRWILNNNCKWIKQ